MNEMDNHKEDWSINLVVGDTSMSVVLKKHLINKEKTPVKYETMYMNKCVTEVET